MRTSNRSGFTLVELLVVMVVGMVLVGAAYQSLMIQQRGYRTTSDVVTDQDALRVALAVLEAELREIATLDDGTIGGSDLLMVSPDSVRVRAPRKLAFVCGPNGVSPSDKSMVVWTEWEMFSAGDDLMIFLDTDETTFTDDTWDTGTVQAVSNSNATCDTKPPGASQWKVTMVAHPLSGVLNGAPVRAFEELTYGLFQFDGEWGLGRKKADEDEIKPLVGGLAGPGEGLVLEYLTAGGAATTDLAQVATIRISLTTADRPWNESPQKSLTSTIYLRNN